VTRVLDAYIARVMPFGNLFRFSQAELSPGRNAVISDVQLTLNAQRVDKDAPF
jgi:hypothetical protein